MDGPTRGIPQGSFLPRRRHLGPGGGPTAEPAIGKYPTEVFGHPYTATSEAARRAREDQHCPFIGDTCKKPRKSEPQIKVGVCSLGYRGRFLDAFRPVLLCPNRFHVDTVYRDLERRYFTDLRPDEEVRWVPEVSLSNVGSVDYVAAKVRRFGAIGELLDFTCVEFQAAGTTGTPFEAVRQLRETGRYSENSYPYGINWVNEFVKTGLQQIYRKGLILEDWGKRLVFVVQDVALEYYRANFDTSVLHQPRDDDSINLFTLKMVWNDAAEQWDLRPDEVLGATTDGIRRILSGVLDDEFPSVESFRDNIRAKMGQ